MGHHEDLNWGRSIKSWHTGRRRAWLWELKWNLRDRIFIALCDNRRRLGDRRQGWGRWWRSGLGRGRRESNIRLQLSLRFHRANLWWGRRRSNRSIHTGVGTAIKTAKTIVWAISVSLSRTPAVGDNSSTLLLRSTIGRCWTLTNIPTFTSSPSSRTKGTLYSSIEAGRC